ncbi:MAG: hypothetical protein ACRC6T_11655 [Sarcina sp.]
MDIIAIVANALDEVSKRGIVVVQGWYDKNIKNTHITFCQLSDRTNNTSDDEEEEAQYIIQVDVWSEKDEFKLKKEVKKLMLKSDFGYLDGQDFFENDTKIHHKALRFNFIEVMEGN